MKVNGRPRLFKTVKEFQERADDYLTGSGDKKISWTGLCLAVGASSRESLQEYKRGTYDTEDENYSDAVKRALLEVENYYEEKGEGAMGIFALKNFGWKDKLELDPGSEENTGKKKKWQIEVTHVTPRKETGDAE